MARVRELYVLRQSFNLTGSNEGDFVSNVDIGLVLCLNAKRCFDSFCDPVTPFKRCFWYMSGESCGQ